jgi:hypothetical protein
MSASYKLQLDDINKKLSLCIELFNTVAIDLKNLIAKEINGSITMNIFYGAIDKIIETRASEPISFFIKHIYSNDIYRKNINDGNEEFFSDQNFDDIIKNDQKKIKILFKFKSAWKHLKSDKKKYITNAMKTMVDICRKYIEEKDNGNKLLTTYL